MEAATEVVTSTPAPQIGEAQVSTDARDAVKPEGDAPEGGEAAQSVDAAAEKEKAALQKGVQRRLDKITREKYEAQARAKMLEERLSAIEQRQQQPAQPADGAEPRIEQFDNFDKYVSAKSKYEAKLLIEATLSEREQRQVAERAQTERASVVEAWNKRVASATAEMPDFEDVITSSDIPMTDTMQRAIMRSELGPKLAYYLASPEHQDEARKIANMDAEGAILSLGRIEERLSKPAEKTITSAPAPLTPIGGTAKVEKDPASMSQKEFNKWRTSVKAKR